MKMQNRDRVVFAVSDSVDEEVPTVCVKSRANKGIGVEHNMCGIVWGQDSSPRLSGYWEDMALSSNGRG